MSTKSQIAVGSSLIAVLAAAGCSAHAKSAARAEVSSVAPGAAPAGGGSTSGDAGFQTGKLAPDVAAPAPAPTTVPALRGRDVISSASLVVTVKTPATAANNAASLTTGLGGYVASEIFGNDSPVQLDPGLTGKGKVLPPSAAASGVSSATLVLRVPARQFETLLSRLVAMGTEVSYSRSSEDVTQQVADVKSRLLTQQAAIARIRALIARATTISDIANLEGQLEQREGNLESMKAQQQSLSDQTTLATITVTMQTPEKSSKDSAHGFVAGLRSGWDHFTSGLRWITEAIGAVLPFLAVLLLAAMGWRILRRRSAGTPAA